MKRHLILFALLATSVLSAVGQAQQRSPNPQSTDDQRTADLQRLVAAVRAAGVQEAGQRRGGGGRGAPGEDPTRVYNGTLQAYRLQVGNGWAIGGAWWTNTALVTRLGLTDEQKTKIERAFENHRQNLAANSESVEKEESQLNKLLQADTIDRNAIFTQIDRVVQARAELERANSAMTLEMREALTKAQWMELQSQPQWLTGGPALTIRRGEAPAVQPGLRGGGGRGQRQQ